ncbi:hypothetical protein A2415_00595 [candidate division WWE3 bacterium RIFOXYC1_FULL_39_7]|uniref:Glycosyl transferase family 1 domain-containing protein n=2 Tax=Katanobacteria TaxID=422282 RepID=A0A1F4X444_UNCKA|nr:MAG: hypothetical protein A2415_00595 [candidate division WWE3 bacterium RIFOXYC1_FULL_39_7]OGC76494.1 MAG: hypothetical protein A2619_06045 [candidate division WWE3 bacterium RIFOXYD1_FULL_39_9]
MNENAGLKKKNVLFFIPDFPVISETFIEREVSKLLQLDNLDINVLAIRKSTGTISPNVLNKTHYLRLNLFSSVLGGLNCLLRPLRFFKAFAVVLQNGNRSLTGNLYIFLKSIGYSWIIKELKPDFILCHFLSEPSTIILIVSYLLDIPFGISAHARDVFGKSGDLRLNSELVKQKAERAKFITVCNRRAYEECLTLVSENDKPKLYLNYHGIDFERMPKAEDNSSTVRSGISIFSVGRLVEKKGFKYLVEASRILKDEGVLHTIKVAGPGPLFEELKKQISDYGLQNTFFILGDGKGIPNIQAMEELSKADIFVLPSIETADKDAEGIPNTILEAAYFKKPIISTKSGSIPEFVENNVTGILVDQKNPEQLAKAIKILSMDKAMAHILGEGAYRELTLKFDLSKNVRNLENLLL